MLFFSVSAKRLVVRGSGSAACWMWASISRNYWWCHESGGVALELSGCPRNFAILDHPSPCHFPQKCFPKMNHRLTKMVAANSQRNVRPECGCDRIATATQHGAGSCFCHHGLQTRAVACWPLLQLEWAARDSRLQLELQTILHEKLTITENLC